MASSGRDFLAEFELLGSKSNHSPEGISCKKSLPWPGRATIFLTLITGIMFAWVNVYVKFENPDFALTHWFNEVYILCKKWFCSPHYLRCFSN